MWQWTISTHRDLCLISVSLPLWVSSGESDSSTKALDKCLAKHGEDRFWFVRCWMPWSGSRVLGLLQKGSLVLEDFSSWKLVLSGDSFSDSWVGIFYFSPGTLWGLLVLTFWSSSLHGIFSANWNLPSWTPADSSDVTSTVNLVCWCDFYKYGALVASLGNFRSPKLYPLWLLPSYYFNPSFLVSPPLTFHSLPYII